MPYEIGASEKEINDSRNFFFVIVILIGIFGWIIISL